MNFILVPMIIYLSCAQHAQSVEDEEFEALKREVAELRQEVQALKSRKLAGEVAFSARKVQTQEYDNVTDTVFFEDVITDIGNMYSPERGEFTAALPGVYYFNVALQADFLHVMCAHLVKNNADIMMAVHATSPHELASTANGVVLDLVAGDTVKVTFNPGCGNVAILGHPNGIGTFTGFFISEL